MNTSVTSISSLNELQACSTKKQSPDGLSPVAEDSQLVTGQWWYQENSGMVVSCQMKSPFSVSLRGK
jgi:hypothetical protein